VNTPSIYIERISDRPLSQTFCHSKSTETSGKKNSAADVN
jgi:hypothetical protein